MKEALDPNSDIVSKLVATNQFYDRYRSVIGRKVFYEMQLHNPIEVESSIDPARLQELLSHIQQVWTQLGNAEPHWSVVSTEEFKANTIADTIDKFNNSGRTEVENLKRTMERVGLGDDFGNLRIALEYGCGVGRVTRWLSPLFDEVIGVDISSSHLELARKYFLESGRKNILLSQIYSPEDLARLRPFDFVYSKIVLQHNPPPVIALILNTLAEKLRPNGVGVVQIPTYAQGYKFKVQDYLNKMGKISVMEMHVLPQQDIFKILDSHDCMLLEVNRDHLVATVDYISSTFVFRKRSRG